jgi:serine/threonine protein kinase/tetratricopeptide (TPR) repeat protein
MPDATPPRSLRGGSRPNPEPTESPSTIKDSLPDPGTHAPEVLPPPTRLAGFEILGELGRGGMGVVYLAADLRRQQRIALKTLPWLDPAALYRFKQEFRALADVSHPNLVSLYELIVDGPAWCLTMEFVEGADFLTYVQTGSASPGGPAPRSAATQTLGEPGECGLELGPPRLSLPHLRDALRQLAEGIEALHAAGKLHRDLKPSNVLVDRAGRVVVLDFGLATQVDRAGLHQSTEQTLLGTVAYMAPEQAAALPVSAASDWYSVGVMLYEALTGRLPFTGAGLHILAAKQETDPPPPCSLAEGIPDDLNALCVELLRRRPEDRPTGTEVLRRLGRPPAPGPAVVPTASAPAALVGRRQHLEVLAEAFGAVLHGRPVSLLIQGRSGVGKSALVQHFLDGLAGRADAVVLAGRCYERESVPFKALDSLVDALSRFLRRLPAHEAEALLPRDVLQLARVFPVLRRVEAVARAPERTFETPDPQEVRRRASAALRELLGRLGDRRPLVLFIDDLQWGDRDSALLVSDLLRPPYPPVLLLLGCLRTEDREASPFLRALRECRDTERGFPPPRELAVEPLSPAEARELARALLGPADPGREARAEVVARESGGNPFFVHELAAHLGRAGPAAPRRAPAEDVSLDQVIWERVQELPAAARGLLEVVAVSGQPLRLADAARAAGVGARERQALAVLRSGRLIRSPGAGEGDAVETYHDRIREAVVARLDPARLREHHRRLAEALEAVHPADPEVLAVHLDGAGEPARAAAYYARAAGLAAAGLAFDHAAQLYRLALERQPAGDAGRRDLQVKLGDVLANAGRGAEAARAYLEAAEGTVPPRLLELRQRAAMQYMASGHTDVGLPIFLDVLAAIGVKFPQSPRWALLALLTRRLQLRLRGYSFHRRDVSEVAADDLRRIDICWSAVAGLSLVDPILGMYFQTRALLVALRAGEAYRIARGWAMEAAYVATLGRSGHARATRLLRVAEELAREAPHPYLTAFLTMVQGTTGYLMGRWQEGREACDRAEALFRDQCTGVTWERDMANTFSLWSLLCLGAVDTLRQRRAVLLQEAQERGDRFAVTNLGTYIMAVDRLGADEPAEAQRELDEVMSRWSQRGFHVQHHNACLAQVLIFLYQGKGEAAYRYVCARWPAYRRSLLLRVQQVRVDALQSRARSALAAAVRSARPASLLRAAARDARRLGREKVPWAAAYSLLIRAGVAEVRGRGEAARQTLAEAAAAFDAVDMRLCAASCRRRLGQLLGGAEGQRLVEAADAWMAGRTIKAPARMAALYTPWLPNPGECG